MNNPILYQAGGALAVLAFLVFLFLCARTWRIWHVIFTFLVFVCAIGFVILATMTLKTRETWKKRQEAATAQLETLDKELETLLHGDLEEVRQTTDSIRSLRGQIERTMVDRGRVWRDCSPTGLANGVVTLSTYTPDPGDPPEAAAEANNRILPKTTVYGFMEVPRGPGEAPWLLYMGEFSAESVTPTSVSLRALTAPDPVQIDAIKKSQGTKWSLYEIVPRDDHRSFATDPDHRPDLGKVGDSLFGAMEEEEIRSAFRNPQARYMSYLQARAQQAPADKKEEAQQLLADAQAAFEAAIESHLTDGQVTDESSHPTADVWVKVRFLQDYTVDVDAQANLGAVSSSDYFDSDGRAQVADLQRGERDEDGKFVPADAEFETDDVAVFHKEAADQLIADGICQEVDSVYVRGLNDFDYTFRHHVQRMAELTHDIALTRRDIKTISDANAKLAIQIDSRTNEKASLEVDKKEVDDELTAIKAYHASIAAAYAKVRNDLSLLYRSNKEMAEKLRKIHSDELGKARQRRRAAELAGQ